MGRKPMNAILMLLPNTEVEDGNLEETQEHMVE